MEALSRQLAAVMSSTDGVPRLITQANAYFLVTPVGEVWRVLDSEEPHGKSRVPPTNDPRVRARVFIGSGLEPMVRVYEFQPDEIRVLSAERLFQQFAVSRIATDAA
jgi:hypothetical protein